MSFVSCLAGKRGDAGRNNRQQTGADQVDRKDMTKQKVCQIIRVFSATALMLPEKQKIMGLKGVSSNGASRILPAGNDISELTSNCCTVLDVWKE